MFAQVHSRALSVLLSFETQLPFDKWDVWSDMRARPLAEQKKLLLDPEMRRRLVEIASKPYEGPEVRGTEARPPEWDYIYAMTDMKGPHKSMAELARQTQHAPGRADDRHGARARHEVLHDPADRQREPGPRRWS